MGENRKLFLVILHFAIGIIYAFFDPITILIEIGCVFYGLFCIISSKNLKLEFISTLLYLVGIEISTRSQNILPHEFVKYAISLLMILYLTNKPKERTFNNSSFLSILFFLLLVPSIFFGDYGDFESMRKLVSNFLSGPLSLAVSGLFFSRFFLSYSEVVKVLRIGSLSIIPAIVFIVINAPNLNEIEWTLGANFESAAYMAGPNQISSIFGFGLFVIFVSFYLKDYFTGYRFLDIGLFGILLFRAILLFSRGGLLSAFISMLLFYIINIYLVRKSFNQLMTKVFQIILVFVITGFLFVVSNQLTDGVLFKRYSGEKGNTEATGERDYFSNREEILQSEIEFFIENPVFGIGPGLGKTERLKAGQLEFGGSSHTEFSRLLGEHGIFGVFGLIVIFLLVNNSLRSNKSLGFALAFGFIILSLSTSFHSATRLAMVGFIFGLSQCRFVPNRVSINEK